MKKIKMKTVIKYHDGERYKFKDGVAVVPGMRWKDGRPFTITITDFNDITIQNLKGL